MTVHEELNRLARQCQKHADTNSRPMLVTWKDGITHVVVATEYNPNKHGSIERVIRPRDYNPKELNEW